MNMLLYAILLLLPLPLFIFIIRRKHHLYCFPPFVALIGIYVFIIVGSFEVIRDERLFSNMYYYSILLIIIFFYIFYIVVFSFGRDLYINWSVTSHSNIDSNIIIPVLAILWSYSFLMLYLYYQRHGLPTVFDVNMFQYVDVYAIRAEKSTNLPEGMHWYVLAFTTIPSFIFSYTYILNRLTSTTITKTIFYFNLPLVLFFSSLTMHKIPFAYLVLYIVLINFFINGKSLGFKKLLGYFAISTGTIVIMIRLYLMDRSFVDVLELVPLFLYNRICVVYTKAHASIVQIFPLQHDFFYGTAFFPNPGNVLPFDPINLSQFLGRRVTGILQNYASPSFSYGYANWGFMGFLLVILMMFFQIILLQIIFKKCPKNPLFLAIYVLIIPKMLGYSNQGFFGIIDALFILLSITIVFIYNLSRDMTMHIGKSKM